MNRLPPYGSALRSRLEWDNYPFFVMVCVGLGAWDKARHWLNHSVDFVPLVLPEGKSPKNYNWPVNNCNVIIDRLSGPGDSVIDDLIIRLLVSGAKRIMLWNKEPEVDFLFYWPKVTKC